MKDSWMKTETMRGMVCAVMLSLMLALVGGCGESGSGGGTSPATSGTIAGQVVSSVTSAPVNGATVKTDSGTVTSGSDGKFTVSAPVAERSVVQVEANGFATAFSITRVTSGQTTNLGVKLIPIGTTASVSVTAGDTVSVPNSMARVVIPANGLVPTAGGTPAGTVNVSLTPINPATDPNLMPGGFTGVTAGGGSDTPIESFGVLGVDIRDAAGARYSLAQGRTATIRIPLGTLSSNPPPTIPLWYFNETTGVWQEEGTATLQGTGASRYYEGTVARFTPYWNADKATESIFVSGCVRDANNQSVPNMLVKTTGENYSGTATSVTKQDGTFRVAMRKDGKAKLNGEEVSAQTFQTRASTNVITVGPSSADITLSDCLVLKSDIVVITTASPLPDGRVGDAYNQTLAVVGGTPGYVWSLNAGSSPLPDGLSLNSAGVIVGTPNTASAITITVKVTDSAGGTATKPLALTIAPTNPPLAITTASPLPEGIIGTAYSTTIAASGGTGARSWAVVGGALPAGLELNQSTGVISGTPTSAGAVTITIRVQDSATPPKSDQKAFALTINQTPPPLNITTSSLPNGVVGTAYSRTIVATGGTGAKKWTVSSGILPDGLTLGESTGVISGTPTTPGTVSITVRVQDSATPPQSDQHSFNLTIAQFSPQPSPLQIVTPSPLPTGAIGLTYNVPILATGGTGSRTWSVTNGALPVGLSLDANTGGISGIPTAAGTSTFTIRVQDSAASPQSNQKEFSLTINASTCSVNCPEGTLTVLNGPASVGGTFTGVVSVQIGNEVDWKESSANHDEAFALVLHNTVGLTYQLIFVSSSFSLSLIEFEGWTCAFPDLVPSVETCSGVTLNRAGGTLTLTNTVLRSYLNEETQPITLNGTLRFTPF